MKKLFVGLLVLGAAFWLNTATAQNISLEKITASDGDLGNLFGFSVSMSSDYAVVGARGKDGDKGSAYVFKRDGNSWIEEAELKASDGDFGDMFGYSVSLVGDYAVVGARGDDREKGSVYVFTRNGTGWSQQAKLTASDGAESDYFGHCVSLSGDYIIVGAPVDDDNGDNSGSAYVFKRDGGGWNQQAKLTSKDGAELDFFGSSVSIAGDYAIVGAFLNIERGLAAGSAYVFKRDGTIWSQQAKLTADDGADFDYFGSTVSLDGDCAIVGARNDNANGFQSGSAYVFRRDAMARWVQEAKLTASDGSSYDRFGESVSITGDCAVVGASLDKHAGVASGSAYTFERVRGNWVEQDKLVPGDGAADDGFGVAVSMADNCILVGSWGDDDKGGQSGSVYVYNNLFTVGVGEETSGLPTQYKLQQNYPNPFNPTTAIRFELPYSQDISLKVYDMLGRSVETLVEGYKPAGVYEVKFDASNLSSGTYVYRIEARETSPDGSKSGQSFVATRKLVLLK